MTNENLNQKELEIQMMKMITGNWISKLIYIASKLNIADLLSDGPISIKELSRITKTKENLLYRIMRALSSVGIFKESESKNFELTPIAECLKSESIRFIALFFNAEWHNKIWDKLFDSLISEEIPFDIAHHKTCSEFLKENPEESKILNKANSMKIKQWYSFIKEIFDFSKFNQIVDVGGGIGTLLLEILKDNKCLSGIIAEQNYIMEEAKKEIDLYELNERCSVIECNFFKKVPKNADLYILSNILHDWDDSKCLKILTKCFNAMKTKSKLLIIEMVLPEGNMPSFSKLLDIEVFVMSGGRERTINEYLNLISKIDFKKINHKISKNGIILIECEKN